MTETAATTAITAGSHNTQKWNAGLDGPETPVRVHAARGDLCSN